MSVVVDANLVVALILPLPYSPQAATRFAGWTEAGVEVLAPTLLEYEVSSVLRKAVTIGRLPASEADEAMRAVVGLGIRCLPPTPELHESALHWAERLGHTRSYDAHYLAVAQQQQAELWTGDRRLTNGARQAGAGWVHWVGLEVA